MNFFSTLLKDRLLATFLFISSFIIGVEVISFHFPLFGWVGIAIWISLYTIFAGTGLGVLCYQLITKRAYITGVVFCYLIGLIVFHMTDERNLSHETPQQISCLLNQMDTALDGGWHTFCFLGYPTRQYLIPALPTLLFGRGFTQVNLGNLLYLFCGLCLFTSGLLANNRGFLGDLRSTLFLSLIMHIGWFNLQLLMYEQSLSPLSHSLMVIGFLLLYYSTRTSLFLFLSVLATYCAIFVYTPALVLIPLEIFALLQFSFYCPRKKNNWLFVASASVILVIGFAVSWVIRKDLRLESGSNHVDFKDRVQMIFEQLIQYPIRSLSESTGGFITISFAFVLIILALSIVASLLSKSKRKELWQPLLACLVVCVWFYSVVIVALLSNGYSWYMPMQRANVAFPPLIGVLAILQSCLDSIGSTSKRYNIVSYALCSTCLIGSIYLGTVDLSRFEATKPLDNQLRVAQWLQSATSSMNPQQKISLSFSEEAKNEFISLRDVLNYFVPAATYEFFSSCEEISSSYQETRSFVLAPSMWNTCAWNRFGNPLTKMPVQGDVLTVYKFPKLAPFSAVEGG